MKHTCSSVNKYVLCGLTNSCTGASVYKAYDGDPAKTAISHKRINIIQNSSILFITKAYAGRASRRGDITIFAWPISLSQHDTILYDTVYLTCSKKLTCSQLSPTHGTNRQINETRISAVAERPRDASSH